MAVPKTLPHRGGPTLASYAQLAALTALLVVLLPVERAATLLAGAEVALFGAFAIGSREEHGLSVEACLCYVAAVALQLLPGRAPTWVLVSASFALCARTYASLVRVWRPLLPQLGGQVVVVTGSSAGLGAETATQLLELGATVVFACRSESRGRAAMDAACEQSGAPSDRAIFVPLDLASCDSISECASRVRSACGRCDALVCNAGLLHPQRTLTADGWEANLACHTLGHHLLARLLLPLLRQSPAGGRVVSVASTLHKVASAADLLADPMSERGYTMFGAYGRSKLAQVALSAEQQRRECARGSGVVCVSLHPGNVITEVTREMPYAVRLAYQAAGPLIRFGAPSLYDGAATTVYAAASDDTATLRGAYLERCLVAQPHADAEDEAVGRQVWELSDQLLAPWLPRDALGGEKS